MKSLANELKNIYMNIKDECFSLKSLARQVESSLRPNAQSKNLSFSIQYPEGMVEFFRGNYFAIFKILNDLINNSIDFTEHGSINLIFNQRDNFVHIQIIDSGAVMAPHQVESLNETDTTTIKILRKTRKIPAITKQLTKLMGGRIDAVSELGRGTTFHVWLPLTTCEKFFLNTENQTIN